MNEGINEGPELFLPRSAVEVLKSAASKVAHFDAQGRAALEQQNPNGYIERMIDKAQVLTELPESLKELSKRDIAVSSEIRGLTMDWSKKAKRSIEDNNVFSMSELLRPKEMQKGKDNKNELEMLILRLESPVSPRE